MKTTIDLSSIDFEVRNGPWGPSVGKSLSRHWIFKEIFEKAGQRFSAAIATADWSEPQTSISLYSDPNWPNLKIGLRIAIGRVLRYFVNQGALPLKVINPRATGTKRYILAQPTAPTEFQCFSE